MDTDMEGITVKVTKKHILLIPKGKIYLQNTRVLWELVIHDSGDQISAAGDVSLWGVYK